jgi:hypothetical protein
MITLLRSRSFNIVNVENPKIKPDRVCFSAGILATPKQHIYDEGQVLVRNPLKAREYGLPVDDVFHGRYRVACVVSGNKHVYPINPSHLEGVHEKKAPYKIKINPSGFAGLIKAYEGIRGAPEFIHTFYRFSPASKYILALAKNPKILSYFSDADVEGFNFIVAHNFKYEMSDAEMERRSSAIFDIPGMAFCVWFHSPHQKSVSDRFQSILEELKPTATSQPTLTGLLEDFDGQKGIFDKDSASEHDANPHRPHEETIEFLKQQGLYLSSILDLKPVHAGALKRLKAHVLTYLEENYHVTDQAQVNLYFHGLYVPDTTTLHLHVRVNQGMLDYEKHSSFFMDELIQHLSSGKTIESLVQARLNENKNSAFYSDCAYGFDGFLTEEGKDLIPGVRCQKDIDNPYYLKPSLHTEPERWSFQTYFKRLMAWW